MLSLLNVPNPIYELTSLQLFYDTMETHFRGLESLKKSHDNYGDILVRIVLGKLPHQVKQTWPMIMAAQNGNLNS